MRIIATTSDENEFLADLAEYSRSKGIYPSLTQYEDGFGITVWSVDDLDEVPVASEWSYEDRLRFMEMYGSKIGGATEDAWVKLRTYVDEYLAENK